ncbi:MAG: exo-alpha-sialidase [Caldilinea sp. CFX5]|nr:exo-alpha-sialidase [Caldilinea sp. CFX5]
MSPTCPQAFSAALLSNDREVMMILGNLSGMLRLVLLFAFVCGLFYLLFLVRMAQKGQSAANAPYHRSLPTVVSTQTTDRPTADGQNERGSLGENTTTTTVGNVVDMTEDYKALGYTDNRKLVRDDDGNLYVAYRKKWQGQYRIFIAKSTDQGKQWNVLNRNKPIEEVGDYTQRVPSFAIGRNRKDDGNFLHLVWYGNDQEHRGNERQIKYLRLTTAGKRSADACCDLNVNVAGYAGQRLWQEHPAIYVNGSNVYIVWEGRDATTTNAKIKFVRSTDFGRTWSEPLDIAPSERINFSRPTLAVAYQGEERQLYVVAYGESQKIAQIYWSRSLDNGDSWTEWQAVSPSPRDQRHVTMARDASDKLHLVWREATATQTTVLRYRVFDPALADGAGNWVAATETIATRNGACLFFPSVALDENEQVWVVWTESRDCHTVPSDDPTSGQISYRVRSATGQWGAPTPLTAGGEHLYASFRSTHTPSSTMMDLVWLDVTDCAKIQDPTEQQEANAEKDTTAQIACVIRYTSLP